MTDEQRVQEALYGRDAIRTGSVKVYVPVITKRVREMMFAVMAEKGQREAWAQRAMWANGGKWMGKPPE